MQARWYIAQAGDRCRNSACRFVLPEGEEEGGWIVFHEKHTVSTQVRNVGPGGFGGYVHDSGTIILSGWCSSCVKRYRHMLELEPVLVEPLHRPTIGDFADGKND